MQKATNRRREDQPAPETEHGDFDPARSHRAARSALAEAWWSQRCGGHLHPRACRPFRTAGTSVVAARGEACLAETPNPDAWRGTLWRRLIAHPALFVVWTAVIQARLPLQVYRHDEFVSKAERQQMRTLTFPGIRGDIVDAGSCAGHERDVDTVYAVPTEIDNPLQASPTCRRAMEDCTPDYQKEADRAPHQGAAFQYVKRHVFAGEAAAVRGAGAGRHRFMNESHRFDPNRDLLGPVLGYVGLDNNGLAGIEKKFEETIRGKDGKVIVVTDAKRTRLIAERPRLRRVDRAHHRQRPAARGGARAGPRDSENRGRRGRHRNRSVDGRDPAMASEPEYNPNVSGKMELKML